MDRITQIENELTNVLKTIDGSAQATYQYLTSVKSVDVEDEVLDIAMGGYPAILVDMNPNEVIGKGESKAYRNTIFFTLTCRVSNTDIRVSPKQSIKIEMNKLNQDIKYVLSDNYHLNDSVDMVTIVTTLRQFNKSNDILRTGDLIVNIKVDYTQSRLNPQNNVCN